MKNLFKNVKAVLLPLVLAGSLAFSATANADLKTKYVVGTEAGYPPFEYLDDKGNIVGFDKDLMEFVCNYMKVECTMINQSFDSLVPSVKFNKIDFAIAGFSPSLERIKLVDFTNEYLPVNKIGYVVANDSALKNVSEIKTVAVQNGTLQHYYLTHKTKYKAQKYDTYDLAILDLLAKRADAVLLDMEVMTDFQEKFPIKLLGEAFTDKSVWLSGPAIAVSKKNAELKAKLNEAIKHAHDSGFIEQLKAKYGITYKY